MSSIKLFQDKKYESYPSWLQLKLQGTDDQFPASLQTN